MKAALPFLLVCACSNPQPAPLKEEVPVSLQEARNHMAWEQHGATLAAESPGDWVLIAEGRVLGHWPTFGDAWGEASLLPTSVKHAYLYRAGIDDREPTFTLSPYLNTDPHQVQLGIRVRKPWMLTIAAAGNQWFRDGKKVAWGDAEALVHLENPSNGATHAVRAVASNLFEYDLTLRFEDARALGLGRFTAPQAAHLYTPGNPCRKALVVLRIPELDIEAPAMAFVLPQGTA